MDIQTRKLNFIQEILAITNEKVIAKLESILKKERKKDAQHLSAHDFLGVISEEEAEKMKKEIQEACENIHDEDWK